MTGCDWLSVDNFTTIVSICIYVIRPKGLCSCQKNFWLKEIKLLKLMKWVHVRNSPSCLFLSRSSGGGFHTVPVVRGVCVGGIWPHSPLLYHFLYPSDLWQSAALWLLISLTNRNKQQLTLKSSSPTDSEPHWDLQGWWFSCFCSIKQI